MAHFAKVVDGIVTKVIVAEPEFFETFVDSSPGQWIQTSYNTRGGIHYEPHNDSSVYERTPSTDQSKALRKNFAGIGYSYDSVRDAFIPPKPFDSWVLNENTCLWEAPIPKPTDGKQYKWDEENTAWVEYTEGE